MENNNLNKPTHFVYQIENFTSDKEEKSYWNKIGSAWEHQDKDGLNIQLKSLPLDGKITIRVAKETKSS